MDPASSWSLLLIILLTGLSGLFSGSETAFFSLNSLDLRSLQEKKGGKARAIIALLSDPRKLLITILLGNETVNVAATSVATMFSINLLGPKGTGVAIGCMLLLLLIFGEITPKTIAFHHPTRFALRSVYFLTFCHKLAGPLHSPLQKFITRLASSFLDKENAEDTIVTEEEFHSLVEIGQAEGILENRQREMIKNALEFTDTTVAEVMTPREKMFCLSIRESLESATKKIKKSFYSRIPAYEKNLNKIKGVLYTKDLLTQQYKTAPPRSIRELIHPPYFVSGDEKVVDLLRDFQKDRIHMAVVVDKAGKTAGLISLEDLLEELFGEITGDAKSKSRLWRKLGHNRYLISVMMHVEDFNQRFDSRLDEEEYNTLEGVLQEVFGTKPALGGKRSYQGMEFTVHRTKGRRILEVMVETPGKDNKS